MTAELLGLRPHVEEQDFYSNTANSSFNPALDVAEKLMDMGFPVRISVVAKDLGGRVLPDHFAIYADPKVATLIEKIENTPEIEYLATSEQVPADSDEELLSNTWWDDETRARVKAFVYSRRAARTSRLDGTHGAEDWKKGKIKRFKGVFKAESRDALPAGSKRLKGRERKQLIKDVVVREVLASLQP